MPTVHVFARDHINTDEIIPARHLTTDVESELAKYAMEDYDKDFVRRVKAGDIIVAGADFGCGSSREHAVWALRGAGVAAVIAPNFARIYYRNSINNGFLALECDGIVEAFEDGDEADLDLTAGTISNRRTGQTLTFVPVPQFALDVQKAGGWLEYMKAGEDVEGERLDNASTSAGHGHAGTPLGDDPAKEDGPRPAQVTRPQEKHHA
ncbi:3-isopropylmalate dehydratase small subunit [Deinococcus wulumuqiensis]|uniref:3-isopropylmalate dehydratase small subunit n=1 Tax=Deinococcus wulumuqiensis TaxID=980427 RepID=A0AAV4JZX8_9DEIO|nr:3-isopropylmalate dehydratase small subunit [Deinococcus wulumuqiensis]QII19720.1 3-isopropylmalate dehydratase small subunit [Deinococcus wulumuqiensis R12]GGI71196.1 3-isopropylmalate dehydratase small subunit 2 [Deinococcus wulumuqiensis]GGP28456.1 3-isopropylmalate dehydratase small subunit 2 [Deinococcus wulumuqiensis]